MRTSGVSKRITIIAMLAAMSYIVMVVGRVPIVLFLKYDPKDIIIVIGGFLYGPLTAMAISGIVSFVEMLTVSDTGIIGLVMNVLSSCMFACTAAAVYKRQHNMQGAIIGLVAGGLMMTAVMLLWNYFIAPIYMGYPREAVAQMLLPVFMPFNLLKSGLNAAFTILLYKPVSRALKHSGLMPSPEETFQNEPGKINLGAILGSLFVIVTCVLLVLVLRGDI